MLSSADATEVRMRQQSPPPNPQPLRALAFSGRRSASGGLFLKAPSSQPVFPFPALAFQRRLLRAVLGLRPRRCSRVASLQASARSCLQTHNTLALALTDAPCPAASSPAAPTWLGLSACALLPGLLLRAASRMPAVAVPYKPSPQNHLAENHVPWYGYWLAFSA